MFKRKQLKEDKIDPPIVSEYVVPDWKEWKIEFPQEQFLRKLHAYYFHTLNTKARQYTKKESYREEIIKISACLDILEELLRNQTNA